MPYYNFEDTQKAAKFLASLDFTIFDTSQGDFTPEHVMYHCTLSYGGESFNTTYQSNPTVHGEPTVADVVVALASDATTAADYDIDDFADEFGFAKPSEAIRAYEGCQKSLEWLRDDLGLSTSDISALNQTLEESADEVREAMEAIVSERQAEHERSHPKTPEGFVTIESLQDDLDLGDYGDQCSDYGEDYITDRFHDVADENIDIYNYDLLQWLPDHYEWLEEADAQGLLEGTNGDIFKMVRAAQYMCFTQDMYDHQEDIVRYVTLESLKDSGVYAVSQELADALDTDVDYEAADTFEEALDGAKEQVQNVMAANLEAALGDEDLAQEAAEELVGGDDYGIVNPAALSVEAVRAVNEKGYDAAFAECDFWKEYTERGEADRGTDTPSLAETAKECRDSSTELAQAGQSHEQERDAGNVER